MSFFEQPPFHDFPDRAIRLLLHHPANLRELVEQAAPGLAPSFLFDRARSLEREFTSADWRHGECDLLFEVPYQAGAEEFAALICLLVEHQSQEDQAAPLRTLLFAAQYWERQWRAWKNGHPRGQKLR